MFVAGGIASYHPIFKASSYYYWTSLAIATVTSFSWAYVARHTENSSKLVVYGLYWDVIMTVTYLVVPVVIFHARMSIIQWIGVSLIMAGIILTKV